MEMKLIKSTEEMHQEIKAATNVEDFLRNNDEHMIRQSLSEHLHDLLEEKGVRKADVARGSLLDRTYVYQIFSGERTPSRDKLLAIAFGFCLSVEETQRMLKVSCNRELYPKDERDALILFALQQREDILEANDRLHSHRFETLGIVPKDDI